MAIGDLRKMSGKFLNTSESSRSLIARAVSSSLIRTAVLPTDEPLADPLKRGDCP